MKNYNIIKIKENKNDNIPATHVVEVEIVLTKKSKKLEAFKKESVFYTCEVDPYAAVATWFFYTNKPFLYK